MDYLVCQELMYYMCIKVQHKPINIQVRDPIQKEQNRLECDVVWRTGVSGVPPDSVRCATRQCPVHQGRTEAKQTLSGKHRRAPL
jgi:hypothetical protein